MSSSTDYLESERKKLWKTVTELQDSIEKKWKEILELRELVEKKTQDYEVEARQASKKCSEFRNKCEATKTEADALLDGIRKIRDSSEESEKVTKQIFENAAKLQELINEAQGINDELILRKDSIDSHIDELEKLFANQASLAEKVGTLEVIFATSDDLSSKIQASYNQLIARKKDFDQIYYGIVGYKTKNPDSGEEEEVTGLKKELENSYAELKAGFAEFSIKKKQEFDETLGGWKAEYSSTLEQIKSLLPHALTTGLSYAYSEKKDAEIKESAALGRLFRNYVSGLIAVSLIPFAVSLYQLYHGVPLDVAILQMPRLVFSILPLYVPVLWVAYSANRKMNLSKRLIEEYTHKEVLSKTFEGLAEQIQNIKDEEVSADLKTRLLYNILEVSSENPGKLISDYNKSDHPLMDALDKSVQLSNAIDKVSKIPGMSKLTSFLDKRSKDMLEDESKKAVAGIESLEVPPRS